MILERPLKGNFHFPVVTGVSADMPTDEREKRMELFAGFIHQIQAAHAGAAEQVSEVDLSDAEDLRATLTGLPGGSLPGGSASGDWGQTEAPLVVHFGDSDFEAKYRTLIENIGQWRATAGRVESVDLRFSREAVVNPDSTLGAQQHPVQGAVHHRHNRQHSTRHRNPRRNRQPKRWRSSTTISTRTRNTRRRNRIKRALEKKCASEVRSGGIEQERPARGSARRRQHENLRADRRNGR